ncbi:MAG: hypothetical protein K2W96_05370 [Gemmataceae bacterium]|nr:hypothetical protein [Gemmataceae bacterium]
MQAYRPVRITTEGGESSSLAKKKNPQEDWQEEVVCLGEAAEVVARAEASERKRTMFRILALSMICLAAFNSPASASWWDDTKNLARLGLATGKNLVPLAGLSDVLQLVDGGKAKKGPVARTTTAEFASKLIVLEAKAEATSSAVYTNRVGGKLTATAQFSARGDYSGDLALDQGKLAFDKKTKILCVRIPDVKLGPVEYAHEGTSYSEATGWWLWSTDGAEEAAEATAVESFGRAEAVEALMEKKFEARYAAERKVGELVRKFLRTAGVKDVEVRVVME